MAIFNKRILSVNPQTDYDYGDHILTSLRAIVDDEGQVRMQQHDIDLDMWDRSYSFDGIIRRPTVSDKRLSDPDFIVVQAPLTTMVNHYKRLTVDELRVVAAYHDITFCGHKKDDLMAHLTCHQCSVECRTLLYAFKECARVRIPRPRGIRMPTTPDDLPHPAPVAGESQPPTAPDSPEPLNQFTHTPEDEVEVHVSPNESVKVNLKHLDGASEYTKTRIIKDWQREMNLENFIRLPCAVCSALKGRESIQRVHASSVPLHILRNDDLPIHVLPTSYNLVAYDRAILEPEALTSKDSKGPMDICDQCNRDLERDEMPKLALCNWLYYARERLPDDVRKAFAEMSVFEKSLVSRIRTNNILCKFSGVDEDPTGETFTPERRHIRGNIISTPLDVARISSVLPPGPSEIADTICALILAARPPKMSSIKKLTPILVRKSRVKLLIDFLLEFNPQYKVSQSFRGFSADHLDSLFSGPSDLGIPKHVQIAHMEKNDAVESLVSDATSSNADMVAGLFMENVSYTLGDHSPQSYTSMTLHAMSRCRQGKPFLYARAGKSPVPDIGNPNWLSWAHPNADPYGIGGFHHPKRRKPISMEIQLRHMLNMHDPFFEHDPVLAFDVYNIIRKEAVNTSLRFCVPYTSYARVVDDIIRLNKDRLVDLRDKFAINPNFKPSTQEDKDIIKIMSSISPVARNVPGTVSQKLRMRNEIRAMIGQRGSPTLFVTMTPADYYNPIVTVLANRCRSAEDIERLQDLSTKERRESALSHPGACAKFFDHTIKSFVQNVLRFGRGDRQGIFGVCDAYYGMVETQGRGTLHCHMLIWLRGHLPPETLQAALLQSEKYRTKLTTWLDSITDTGFIGSRSYLNMQQAPVDELGMIKEPHPGTQIGPQLKDFVDRSAFDKEMKEFVDELLLRFNWHRHCATCWKYLGPKDAKIAENCRFGMDGQMREQTTVDMESGLVTARRRNSRMTQYNPITTFLLKCNTDIKFIGSGEDAKAFMYYVTDYITKAPLSMYSGLSALTYAIKQGEDRGLFTMDGSEEATTRRIMTTAVNSMLGRQEISHPQVMSFISGAGEHYTSESFQAINWGEIVKYTNRVLDESESEGRVQVPTPTDVTVSVGREGNRIEVCNQLLDYVYRPSEHPFNSMSLYSHIAKTRKIPRSHQSQPSISRRNQCSAGKRFSSPSHPQQDTHLLKMRSDTVVPVLLGPKISRRRGSEVETEQWAKDMCILFHPWRNPMELRPRDHNWTQSLDAFMPMLDPADRTIVENMSLVSEGRYARDSRPRRPIRKRGGIDATDLMDNSDQAPTNSNDTTYSGEFHDNAYSLLDPSLYTYQEMKL